MLPKITFALVNFGKLTIMERAKIYEFLQLVALDMFDVLNIKSDHPLL